MVCPKCGGYIKPFDLKPNCRHCGVNIMYYTQENTLSDDAKKAELEFACARIIIARVRAAFIGGKLPIARLVFSLLCVAVLVIPFCSVKLVLPASEETISVGGIGLYSLFSGGMLTALPGFLKSTLFGNATLRALIACGGLVLLALNTVTLLVLEILSFTDIKKIAKKLCTVSIIGMVLAVVNIGIDIYVSLLPATGCTGASFGFGAIAALLVNGVSFYLNRRIYKEDLPLKIKPFDYERRDTLRKLRKGEIKLEDLSLPVFETEEEKEKRINDLKEALGREEAYGVE